MSSTIVADYERKAAVLEGHTLTVITYRLGHKFVCCIDNFDPGVAICRTTGSSREQALALALSTAKGHLQDHSYLTQACVPVTVILAKIVLGTGEGKMTISVPDFLRLTLKERMDYILSGQIQFLDGLGHPLPAGEAMRMLKKASDQAYAA